MGPRGGSLCTNISLGLVVNLPQNIGPYQVVRLLGQGGMGVVYEVVHSRQPGKRLALKLILADEPPPDVLTRFQREAELLAKVSHPNIVGVLDFASDAGRPYMVFDYVAGEDLRSLCSASPMDPQQVARIGRDLAAALDLLHRRGIIHRDLKPENVILRPDGSPVLLDFGLARELDAERLTVTGTILGTPSFMAPEQANGLTDLDGRTDVYGLGAILFFLLLGRPPFRGTTPMGILRQVLMEEPKWDLEVLVATDVSEAPPPPLPSVLNTESTWAPGAQPPGESTVWTEGPAGEQTEWGGAVGPASSEPTVGIPPPGAPGAQPPGKSTVWTEGPAGEQTEWGGAVGPASSEPTVGIPPPGDSTVDFPPRAGLEAYPGNAADLAAKAEATSRLVPASSSVPRPLEAIVRVAMAKERTDRYLDVAALGVDLERFLSGDRGDAAGRLRSIGWRRRRKAWLALLVVAIAALAVAEVWRRGRVRDATPTSSPTTGTPDPALVEVLKSLPPIGSSDFAERLKEAREANEDAVVLVDLGRAQKELNGLRSKSGAERTAAVGAWRKAHSGLPPRLLGPVQLELGPRWSWVHEVPKGREGKEKLDDFLESSKNSKRRAYLGIYGVQARFLNAAGTQVLVANGRKVSVWDLKGGEPAFKGESSLPKGPTELSWEFTFSSAHSPNSGLTFLGGTVRPGDSGWVGLAVFGRTSLLDVVGLPADRVLNGRSDRMICLAVSPDGRWLGGGTDQGEVLVVPVRRTYEGAFGQDSAYQLGTYADHADIQSVVFLDEERLVSVSGDKSKNKSKNEFSLRLWRVGRGGRELTQEASYKRSANGEPPSLLVRLSATEFLLGRSQKGRVYRFRVEGTSIIELAELQDGDGPALLRSPTCGVFQPATPWGQTAILGGGLFVEEGEFPSNPPPGTLSAWVGPDLQFVSRYRLTAPGDGFSSVDVSADGRRIVAGTQLGSVLVFELLPRPDPPK